MRSWEIFRFEIAYQSGRVSTWLYFAVLLPLTYYVAREAYVDIARSDGYFFNAPFVIAVMTFLGSMMGLLSATRHCTTILISHRFSTVRHADRICVLERGRVVELGTHDELIAAGGRYRTMFDLQAQRFQVPENEEGMRYDVLS